MIALFIMILWLPVLDSLLEIAPELEMTEQRQLNEFPDWEWNIQSLQIFPEKFRRYYNDHFGLRNHLLRLNNLIHLKLLNTSNSKSMIIGKGDWLYYTGDGMIEDYRGIIPFTESQLDKMTLTLRERHAWLEKKGIQYMVLIAPNKITIYPEYLPNHIVPVYQTRRMDQVLAHLKKYFSELNVVDLRPALYAAKSGNRVYESTGTHWNNYGAFIGYQEMMRGLGLSPKTLDDFELQQITINKPTMAGTYMPTHLNPPTEEVLEFIPKKAERYKDLGQMEYKIPIRGVDPNNPQAKKIFKVDDTSLPSVLFFRDSFVDGMHQFIREDFRQTIYIASREFDAEIILHAKPEIVVNQMVERYIEQALIVPENGPLPK